MTSTVQQYFDLTKKYKNIYGTKTLVLMQVGSFFECYAFHKDNNYEGSNIVEFTNVNDMIIAKKKQLHWRERCCNGWVWNQSIRKIC